MAAEQRLDPVTPRQVALVTAAFAAIVLGALSIWQVSRSGGTASWWWALIYAAAAFGTVFLIDERGA